MFFNIYYHTEAQHPVVPCTEGIEIIWHAVHSEYRTTSSSMPMPIREVTQNACRSSVTVTQLKYTAVGRHPQPYFINLHVPSSCACLVVSVLLCCIAFVYV